VSKEGVECAAGSRPDSRAVVSSPESPAVSRPRRGSRRPGEPGPSSPSPAMQGGPLSQAGTSRRLALQPARYVAEGNVALSAPAGRAARAVHHYSTCAALGACATSCRRPPAGLLAARPPPPWGSNTATAVPRHASAGSSHLRPAGRGLLPGIRRRYDPLLWAALPGILWLPHCWTPGAGRAVWSVYLYSGPGGRTCPGLRHSRQSGQGRRPAESATGRGPCQQPDRQSRIGTRGRQSQTGRWRHYCSHGSAASG
jgi:hypothetical protein